MDNIVDDYEILNVLRLSDVEKLVIETLTKFSVPTNGIEFNNVMLRIIDVAQPTNNKTQNETRLDPRLLLYVEKEVLMLLQNLTIDDLSKSNK